MYYNYLKISKYLKPIIITLIILMVSSCGKDCRHFPEHLLHYLSYNDNKFIFTNKKNDTLKLIKKDYGVIGGEHIPWNCKCVCDISAYVNSDTNNYFNIGIQGRIFIYDERNDYRTEISYSINSPYESTDRFHAITLGQNPFDKKNINLFGDTVIFEGYDDFTRFKDLVVVANKGIVEFWDEEQKCKWIRVDN